MTRFSVETANLMANAAIESAKGGSVCLYDGTKLIADIPLSGARFWPAVKGRAVITNIPKGQACDTGKPDMMRLLRSDKKIVAEGAVGGAGGDCVLKHSSGDGAADVYVGAVVTVSEVGLAVAF